MAGVWDSMVLTSRRVLRMTDFLKTISHEKQKTLFRQIIENGRLSHAYVFVGPENIGKTTFALDLAQALGADPVLDMVFLDNENGLQIEEARLLQSRLSLTPVGHLKVAIITPAEKMTLEAGNCLLKTLEEPPAKSLLILITSNFYALLPTVASRVQRINFGPAPTREGLETALQDFDLLEQKKEEIMNFAAGRIGLAKNLASQPDLLKFYREAQSYYELCEKGSLLQRLQAAEKLAALEKKEIETFLRFAMRQWVQGADLLRFPLGEKLQAAWQDLQYHLNLKLLLDNLFLPQPKSQEIMSARR